MFFCLTSWQVDLLNPRGNSKKRVRILNRTSLRNKPGAPFWTSVRWLSTCAERSESHLHNSCAIDFGGEQPRAALLCLSVNDSPFSVEVDKS